MKIQRLNPKIVPAYALPGDAGFDLQASIYARTVIVPGQRMLVPTGIKVAIPTGYVGFITPRSGLAIKYGISIVNAPGTIDSGYRGEIGVILENRGQEPFIINPLDKIAQMVVILCVSLAIDLVDSLDDTQRGSNGFGSTS
jgi:dUTP pyrophosphatase